MSDLLKVLFMFYLILPFVIAIAIFHYDLWLWVVEKIIERI